MTIVGQFGFGLLVVGGLVLALLRPPVNPEQRRTPPSLRTIYLIMAVTILTMFLIGYTTAAHEAVATGDIRAEDLVIK